MKLFPLHTLALASYGIWLQLQPVGLSMSRRAPPSFSLSLHMKTQVPHPTVGNGFKTCQQEYYQGAIFPFFLPSRGLCMWPPNQKPCFEYFLGISAIWWIEQLPQPLAFSARTSLLLSAVLPWRPLLQGIPCLHKSAFWREFHKATDKFQQMIPFVPCLLESFSAQAIIQ